MDESDTSKRRYEFELKSELLTLQAQLRERTQSWAQVDFLSMHTVRRMSWTAQHMLCPPEDFPYNLSCANYSQEANELNHRVWAYLLAVNTKARPNKLLDESKVKQPLLVRMDRTLDNLTVIENKVLLLKYLLTLT